MNKTNNKVKQIISLALIVLAAALIFTGVRTGGYRDVWNKARMICYECIGIG